MLLAMAIMMAAVPGVQAQVTHGVNRADMDLDEGQSADQAP